MVNFHCISSLYWAIYNPRRGAAKKRAKSKRIFRQNQSEKSYTARLFEGRCRQRGWISSEISNIAI